MSELNYFRDQYKNPDKYPRDKKEMAEAFAIDGSKPVLSDSSLDKLDSKEKKEVFSTWGKNYENVVNLISEYEEEKVDAEEREILKKRKVISLGLLKKVLSDIDSYILQINVLKDFVNKNDSENIRSYQLDLGQSDMNRRDAHNRLINDLKITIRLLNVFYNANFPEKERIKFEKGYADRTGKSEEEIIEISKKKSFIEFPVSGVIIDSNNMPKDPIGERNYIADWAFSIFKDLTVLKNEIPDL